MSIKDWNGFKKSGDTYIPNDATARAGVTATVDLMKDTTGWIGGNLLNDEWYKGSSHVTTQKDNHSFTLTTDNQDQYATISFFDSEIISGTGKGALFPAGKYVITLNVTAIGDDTARLAIRRSVDSIIKKQVLQLGDNVFDIDTNESFYISIFPRYEKTTVTTLSFNNLMMLTAEQYALNPAYRPYHESVKEILATKDVTVTAGTDVTVNANTHVYSKAGVVTGSLRLEIGATLTAGAIIATLSAIPKNTTYAIGIDNTDKSVIPIIIGNNGAVQLFGGFIPTSGNQLLIPIAYATAQLTQALHPAVGLEYTAVICDKPATPLNNAYHGGY